MKLMLGGLSHKTAPIAVRERLTFDHGALKVALQMMQAHVPHGVILSTCNRTEIYWVMSHEQPGRQDVVDFLVQYHGVPDDGILNYLYWKEDEEAARHLFRVAAGLDSLVVGEYQILGQVREALGAAAESGVLDHALVRLFHQAIRVGRKARDVGNYGRQAISVSSAGVRLAQEALGTLDDKAVLIAGAGEMGKLAATVLVEAGASRVIVANRSPSKAARLAQSLHGEALPFEHLRDALLVADIVITSSSSRAFLLDRPLIEEVMAQRKAKGLFILDIAMPRNVQPEVAHVPGVTLCNVDDLQAVTGDFAQSLEIDMPKVNDLITEDTRSFMGWWYSLKAVPMIKALRHRAEAIRQGELDKTLKRLPELSDAEALTVEALSKAIVNKLLHDPILNLKELAEDARSLEMIRDLFSLEEGETDNP